MSISMTEMIPFMVRAIQELSDQCSQLTARIASLEASAASKSA